MNSDNDDLNTGDPLNQGREVQTEELGLIAQADKEIAKLAAKVNASPDATYEVRIVRHTKSATQNSEGELKGQLLAEAQALELALRDLLDEPALQSFSTENQGATPQKATLIPPAIIKDELVDLNA